MIGSFSLQANRKPRRGEHMRHTRVDVCRKAHRSVRSYRGSPWLEEREKLT